MLLLYLLWGMADAGLEFDGLWQLHDSLKICTAGLAGSQLGTRFAIYIQELLVMLHKLCRYTSRLKTRYWAGVYTLKQKTSVALMVCHDEALSTVCHDVPWLACGCMSQQTLQDLASSLSTKAAVRVRTLHAKEPWHSSSNSLFWHSFQCSFSIFEFGHSAESCWHMFNVYTSSQSWDMLRQVEMMEDPL